MIYSFVLDVLTLVKVEGFHKHTNDIRHLSAPLNVCTISISGCSTSNPLIKSDKKKKENEGVEKPCRKKLTVKPCIFW